VRVEAIENRRKLSHDVREMEAFTIELGMTLRTEPGKRVELSGKPFPLNHEPDRATRPLRRVRNFGRQKEDLAFTNRNVDGLPLLQNAKDDVALDPLKILLALVDMVVGSHVRATHHGDHELPI